MLGLLHRLWALPWPAQARRLAARTLRWRPLELLLLPHFLVGVVGVILNERDEVLVLRHTYRREFPWGLPTGFLERGEQPLAALRREIGEEAGFRVDLSPRCTVYVEAGQPLVNVVFQGVARGGNFRPSHEVSEARFFSRDALPPLMPSQRRLLDELARERGATSSV